MVSRQKTKTYQGNFNSLSGAERIALFAFLDALTDIISGAGAAKNVEDPQDYNLNITQAKAKGSPEPEKKKKKSSSLEKAKGAAIVVGQ